jgi:hypothetical protein
VPLQLCRRIFDQAPDAQSHDLPHLVARVGCCPGSRAARALAPPLDRNDGPSPRSASAAPDALFEVEHLGPGAQTVPEQKLRRQQRDMMAGGAIDLDEIAMPKILDPRQVKGCIPTKFPECSKGARGSGQRLSRSDATAQARRGVRISFGNHRRTVCAFPKRARTGSSPGMRSLLNGASTALVRNALREADAPVFLALRYRAAHRPACREARVLCP